MLEKQKDFPIKDLQLFASEQLCQRKPLDILLTTPILVKKLDNQLIPSIDVDDFFSWRNHIRNNLRRFLHSKTYLRLSIIPAPGVLKPNIPLVVPEVNASSI